MASWEGWGERRGGKVAKVGWRGKVGQIGERGVR